MQHWVSIVQGNIPCTPEQAVKLAAIQYQAYFIDRTAVHSVVGFCRYTHTHTHRERDREGGGGKGGKESCACTHTHAHTFPYCIMCVEREKERDAHK